VHFTAVNHPVVGDILYAPKKPFALGFVRTALHARSVEFETLEGKRVKVLAPLPEDFVHASTLLGAKV
jgi:23S rRNA-/tRNA-specific pseudouridylate synthase